MTRPERIREWLFEASSLRGAELEAFLDGIGASDPRAAAELRSLVQYVEEDDERWTGSAMLSPGVLEPVPERIGHYVVDGLIGDGGMGRVFGAHQAEPIARSVAIKLIKPGMDSEDVLRRFRNERRTLERLDHPSICRALDAGLDQAGRPYIVMERIDGPTISEYCRIHELGTRSILALFRQVCDAVRHAHMRGLLHRDLKPSNILMVEEGGSARAKVIDFGMATLFGPSGDDRSFELSDAVHAKPVGTLDYMSPEQSINWDVDERSDVYSLGVVLYVLLAGALPHDPAELRQYAPRDLESYLRDREVVPPSRLGRDGSSSGARRSVGRELDWICLRAMEGEPDRRYGSVDALLRDVDRLLAGDVVEAAPSSRSYRLRKALRRHRVPVAVSVVAVSLSAVVAGTSYAAYARVERARAEAERALGDRSAAAEYLGEILRSAGPFGLGPEATLRDLLGVATERIEERLASAPSVRVVVRPYLARAHLELGDLDAAGIQLRRAEEEAAEFLADDPGARARIRLDLAHWHELSGRFEAMRTESLRALGLFDEAGEVPSEATLRARAYVGLSRYRSADSDVAVPEIREATRYARQHGLEKTPTGIRSRVWLAGALQWSGENDEAMDLLVQLAKELEELPPGDDGDLYWEVGARVHRELGAAHLNGGEPALAIPHFDAVIETFTERLGAEDRATLAVRADRALARTFVGDRDGAIDELEDLVEAYTRVLGPGEARTLALQANLVSIRLMAEQFALVVDEVDAMLDVLDPENPGHAMTTAQVLGVRGAALLWLEDPEAAVESLFEARELMIEAGGSKLPVYRSILRDLVRALEATDRGADAQPYRDELEG